MEYASLGRTGLKVSRLCLGTMNFGARVTEPDSFALMDRALALGINFFDTADGYGGKMGEGITEQIIGRWLAKSRSASGMILATKGRFPMGKGPNDLGLSRRQGGDGLECELVRPQAVPCHQTRRAEIDHRLAPGREATMRTDAAPRPGRASPRSVSGRRSGWRPG